MGNQDPQRVRGVTGEAKKAQCDRIRRLVGAEVATVAARKEIAEVAVLADTTEEAQAKGKMRWWMCSRTKAMTPR